MRTLLYTNENTKTCVWESETHKMEGRDSDMLYDVMSVAHQRINYTKDMDLVEGIRLLLKVNGDKIDKKQ